MKMNYVTIRVNQLEASTAFFQEVMGMTETRRITPRPGMAIVFLDKAGQSGVELIAMEGYEGRHDAVSLTFDVPDMDAALAHFASHGIRPEQGPMPIGGGGLMSVLRDPSAIQIGLIWQPEA